MSDAGDELQNSSLADAWTAAHPSGQTRRAKIAGKFQTAVKLATTVSSAARVLNGQAMRVKLLFESTERPCSLDPYAVSYDNLHATLARMLGLTSVGIAEGKIDPEGAGRRAFDDGDPKVRES
jgi:hypothetical protein